MRWVIIVVLALAALHLWGAIEAPLGPDETYYFLWSRYPAIGYFDHPPMIAWSIWLSTKIFGDGALGIRFFPVLTPIFVSLVIYATGRVLFEPRIAERAVLWFNASLLVGVGAILSTPDPSSVLFWSLAVLALALLVKSGRGQWWLAIGLFAGLGALSKYTDLFLGLGLVFCLLLHKDLRHWLISPWTWAGGAVAVAVFSPVLLWNYAHHGASFAKQFGRIQGADFHWEYFFEYVATQIGLINPFVAVFLGLAVAIWLKWRPSPHGRPISILIATVLPLIAYMTIHTIHAPVQAHWLVPIYPSLALIAAGASASVPDSGRWRVFFANAARAILPLGLMLSAFGVAYIAKPYEPLLPPEDPADLVRDWQPFVADANALREKIGATWIATVEYNMNSELAYHLRQVSVPVVQINERIRYSFAPPPDPGLLKARALLIKPDDWGGVSKLEHCFAKLTPVGTLIRRGPREVFQRFDAYEADGPADFTFDAGCEEPR